MNTTLMVNDEYFGEKMLGTRDEFRATLLGNFRAWYADYEGEMSFDEYVENALDEHLTEADADEIENCERLDAPVPSKIKAARVAAGLTQEQAARVIGATRRAWQEWEAGRRNMPCAKWELFQKKIKGEKTMSDAKKFFEMYDDVTDLMTALDASRIESDQDWDNEATTWTFADGSKIRVSGPDAEVID